MFAFTPIASKLWLCSKTMRGAMNGLTHRSKEMSLFDHFVGDRKHVGRYVEDLSPGRS
jgi:hypothetical protein